MLDESEDLERMLRLIYDLYDEEGTDYLSPAGRDDPASQG